jgi:HEAT repeat protein
MAKRTARSAKHDVTRLVALLSSADTAVAGDAANQLTQMGPKAERAIPDLVRYLARSAFSDRVFFVGSELPRMGRAVFEPLLREFERRDTRALDHTFGCVAPNHPDLAIPLLKHDRPHIRLATCYALYKQKSAVEPLIESLADRSPRIREIAGCALKSIGSAAIRQLKAAMEQSADAEFRERCLNVLAQIRPSQYAKRTSRFQKERARSETVV